MVRISLVAVAVRRTASSPNLLVPCYSRVSISTAVHSSGQTRSQWNASTPVALRAAGESSTRQFRIGFGKSYPPCCRGAQSIIVAIVSMGDADPSRRNPHAFCARESPLAFCLPFLLCATFSRYSLILTMLDIGGRGTIFLWLVKLTSRCARITSATAIFDATGA